MKSPAHIKLDEALERISKLKHFDDKVNQLRQLVVECEDYIKINYGSLV